MGLLPTGMHTYVVFLFYSGFNYFLSLGTLPHAKGFKCQSLQMKFTLGIISAIDILCSGSISFKHNSFKWLS